MNRFIVTGFAAAIVSISAMVARAEVPRPEPRPAALGAAAKNPLDPLGIFSQVQTDLQSVVAFFTTWTDEDIANATALATAIPDLQDPVGAACWKKFANMGAVIKAHPLPVSLKLASDLEGLRLFSMSLKQVCGEPNCSQVWNDLSNQISALGGVPVPPLSQICAKIP